MSELALFVFALWVGLVIMGHFVRKARIKQFQEEMHRELIRQKRVDQLYGRDHDRRNTMD